ncbi:orotidine-5'-phosphate decarboxylase [Alkalihalobacillus trypoxylicola]|uniref:Orotidine 5'-phosphate decarboxylase n=1 Tax=Alkalihalobacillus trypoxylicola TaxID=519424 RepID=A0A161PLA8_9BACI|nr:orotidine-5'-phosphate decarboxylase [Alkalihalobacillus trypoxylicola]KYG35146.1 orotidine 5'-phosphate decarboxylase [Alkalihalobacillus trypoxylicola]
MQHPLMIALDVDHPEKRKQLLESFGEEPLFLKVGMEMFYREGISALEELKKAGHSIFLDLKLHDIPNTVKRSMKVLATLGIDMVNVHAAGGIKMMKAALEGLEEGTAPGRQRPKLIAVTQLTSTDSSMLENELLITQSMDKVVLHYAKLAQEAGLDGVVCSAKEVPLIHAECGKTFLTVTPGIRQENDAVGDQKRVVTPQMARSLGSDAIVVGRSITASENPLQTYRMMKANWGE